jgi:hypothetical protein
MVLKCFHGSTLLTYNESFARGNSWIVGLIFCKIIRVVNIVFKILITWLAEQRMEAMMLEFKTNGTYLVYMVL